MSNAIYEALAPLAGPARSLLAGETLFNRGDPVRHIYLLSTGSLVLQRTQEDGAILTLHRVPQFHVVAEASIYSPYYHCDCQCESDAKVHAISAITVKAMLQAEPVLAEIWPAYLAAELQATRYRCEILTLKKVSARLEAWINWHGALPPRGEWKSLALELGVSPEALYREIKKQNLVP